MKKKPIIGLVMALTPEDHHFTAFPAYRFEFLKQQYYEAVEDAGAVAIGIPNTEHHESIDAYCEIIDGLLLVGGEDIHPEVYGELLTPISNPMMPRRDSFECKLILACHAKKLPVLGICRGLQIMNVAFGGTLYQDLSLMPGAGIHGQVGEFDFSTRHNVTLMTGTRLHEIIGADRIETNTGHHQGINALGKNLVISARADDGVIEAIEASGFTIGVQWHPESWSHDPVSRKIFSAFTDAAR